MSTLAEYHGACVSGDKPEPPKPKAAIRTAAPQDNQYIQAIKNDVESWNPKRADQELFMANLRNCLINGTIQPEELGMPLGFIKSLMTLHRNADKKNQERYKQLMEALKIDKWLDTYRQKFDALLDKLKGLQNLFRDAKRRVEDQLDMFKSLQAAIQVDIDAIDGIHDTDVTDGLNAWGDDQIISALEMAGENPDEYRNTDGTVDREKLKDVIDDKTSSKEEELARLTKLEGRVNGILNTFESIDDLETKARIMQALEDAGVNLDELDLTNTGTIEDSLYDVSDNLAFQMEVIQFEIDFDNIQANSQLTEAEKYEASRSAFLELSDETQDELAKRDDKYKNFNITPQENNNILMMEI